jgi:hypothetical protein
VLANRPKEPEDSVFAMNARSADAMSAEPTITFPDTHQPPTPVYGCGVV